MCLFTYPRYRHVFLEDQKLQENGSPGEERALSNTYYLVYYADRSFTATTVSPWVHHVPAEFFYNKLLLFSHATALSIMSRVITITTYLLYFSIPWTGSDPQNISRVLIVFVKAENLWFSTESRKTISHKRTSKQYLVVSRNKTLLKRLLLTFFFSRFFPFFNPRPASMADESLQ